MSAGGRRPCRLVALALLLVSSDSWAQDALALRVELREAGTRRVLRGARCALARRESGEFYGRFDAPDYRGSEPVREGDELLVYRRGFDLGRVRLPPGCRSVTVSLAPSSRKCVIVLQGAGEEDPRFHLVWSVTTPFGARDRYRAEAAGARVAARIPAGATVDVSVESRGLVAWPRRAPVPDAGGTIELQLEPAWRPTLRLDPPAQRLEASTVEFFPDFLFRPPGPEARIDAWRLAVHRPWWGRSQPITDGVRLALAPPAPLHVVATLRGRTVVRHVRPGAEVIDLRGLAPPRALEGVPLVDGRPAAAGSVVLPGRLDVATVAAFRDVVRSHPGLLWVVPAAGELAPAAPRPTLPDSPWLTVWHPVRGLAHLAWRKGERPQGRTYPGSMVIRAPRGWRLDGTVVAFPVWHGTNAVRTVPPDTHLRRACERRRTLRYGGIRPGWHAFDLRLDLVQNESGRRHRIDYIHEVEFTDAQPHREYALHDPDRQGAERRR